MKTRAYVLVCQVYEVEVGVNPVLVSAHYPDYGNTINFMDRDKLTYPEQFGKLISENKSLIHCLPVNQFESQGSPNIEESYQ